MARRCRHTKQPLPSLKESDFYQRKGFADLEAMAAYGIKKAREYAARKQAKESRESRDETRRKNDEDRGHQETLTQNEFNRMIRLLDAGKPCISCGKHVCGFGIDAGHYHSVASSYTLRYDARNCHSQGTSCNRSNHKANYKRRANTEHVNAGYQQGIVDRYGKELLDFLDGPHEPKHYSIEDLKGLRKVFAAECRRLERGEGPSRNWRELSIETRAAA